MENNLKRIYRDHFFHHDIKTFYKLLRSYTKYKYTFLKNPRFHHKWMDGCYYSYNKNDFIFIKTFNEPQVDGYCYQNHVIQVSKLIEYDLFIQRKIKLKKIKSKLK